MVDGASCASTFTPTTRLLTRHRLRVRRPTSARWAGWFFKGPYWCSTPHVRFLSCAGANVFAAPRGHERRQDCALRLLLFHRAGRPRGTSADQGRAVELLRRERGAQDDLWQVSQGAIAPFASPNDCLPTLVFGVRRPTRASSTESKTTFALRFSLP
jgi:hypothetical protein